MAARAPGPRAAGCGGAYFIASLCLAAALSGGASLGGGASAHEACPLQQAAPWQQRPAVCPALAPLPLNVSSAAQHPLPFRVPLPAATDALVARTLAAHPPTRYNDGGRAEWALDLSDPAVRAVVDPIAAAFDAASAPLVFASLLVAEHAPGAADQRMHGDRAAALPRTVHALVYLTDVATPAQGALELECCGPVLGQRGSGSTYLPGHRHRGLANVAGPARRVALGLAFSAAPAGSSVHTIMSPNGVEGYILAMAALFYYSVLAAYVGGFLCWYCAAAACSWPRPAFCYPCTACAEFSRHRASCTAAEQSSCDSSGYLALALLLALLTGQGVGAVGVAFFVMLLVIPATAAAALVWAYLATLQSLLRQQQPLSQCMGRVAWVPAALFLLILALTAFAAYSSYDYESAFWALLSALPFIAISGAPVFLIYRRLGAPPAYTLVAAAQAPAEQHV